MSKLTAAIIEDEVPAARLLSSIITRLRPDWEVTVLPGSVEEAIVWFRTHSHPDILFLDIQLSDGNSFDFLSAAQPSSLIIFTALLVPKRLAPASSIAQASCQERMPPAAVSASAV